MKKLRWIAAASFAAVLFASEVPSEAKRWWSHILYLADDKLQGRNTGSEGYRKAAVYVAGEFERAGLKPAGISGYFQPVKFKSREIVEEESSLALVQNRTAEPLTLGEDATISMRVDPAESVEGPLVFIGYGLTVPEMKYDDLAGLDLRGKIAVYVSGGPSSIALGSATTQAFTPPARDSAGRCARARRGAHGSLPSCGTTCGWRG